MWVAWALDWIGGPEASWDLSKPASRKAGVYSFSALDCGWEHNTGAWVPALTSPKWQTVMWDCKPIPAPRLLLIRVFYCSREDETKAVGFEDGICYHLPWNMKHDCPWKWRDYDDALGCLTIDRLYNRSKRHTLVTGTSSWNSSSKSEPCRCGYLRGRWIMATWFIKGCSTSVVGQIHIENTKCFPHFTLRGTFNNNNRGRKYWRGCGGELTPLWWEDKFL